MGLMLNAGTHTGAIIIGKILRNCLALNKAILSFTFHRFNKACRGTNPVISGAMANPESILMVMNDHRWFKYRKVRQK
jgi:hypothetical protein